MLKDPAETGFDQVDDVGYAFRRPGGQQYHVGILYKSGDQVRLRHQCDHLETRDEIAGHPSDLWTDIAAIKATNKAIIAARLAKVGGDTVPYGVGYKSDKGYIDKRTLKYCLTTPGDGLTCATYIVAILEALGYAPFDHTNWLPTINDVVWQANILGLMAGAHSDAGAHFAAEQANIGAPRYQPEHVVASGVPAEWPLSQVAANDLGVVAKSEYNRMRPQQPGAPIATPPPKPTVAAEVSADIEGEIADNAAPTDPSAEAAQ